MNLLLHAAVGKVGDQVWNVLHLYVGQRGAGGRCIFIHNPESPQVDVGDLTNVASCTVHAHCPVAQHSVILFRNMNDDDNGGDACPVLPRSSKLILLNGSCLRRIAMRTPPPALQIFHVCSVLSVCFALFVLVTHLMSKLPLSSASLFYSVAKEQRTLTSSSHAPSPSSHHRTSWSSPTSTRPSSQASPSSTRSLCTRHSVTAYEKDGGNSLKSLPVHWLTTTRSRPTLNLYVLVLFKSSNLGFLSVL